MPSIEIQKLVELAKEDQSFLKAICESKSAQEIQSICAKRNLTISTVDAQELFDGIKSECSKSTDELAESDLENVAGGFFVTWGTVFVVGAGLYGLYRAGKAVGKFFSR